MVSTGPVAEIGLRRLSIEAEPVVKSKRLPQVFRIGVSPERDKKAVQEDIENEYITEEYAKEFYGYEA